MCVHYRLMLRPWKVNWRNFAKKMHVSYLRCNNRYYAHKHSVTVTRTYTHAHTDTNPHTQSQAQEVRSAPAGSSRSQRMLRLCKIADNARYCMKISCH